MFGMASLFVKNPSFNSFNSFNSRISFQNIIQETNSLQNQNDGSSSDDKSSANRFLSKLRPISRFLLVNLIRSGKVNSSVSQVALRKARRCPYRGRSVSSPYPYHSSRSPSASPTPSFVPPTGFSLWICFVAVRSSHLCRRSLWKKRRSVRVVGGQRLILTFTLLLVLRLLLLLPLIRFLVLSQVNASICLWCLSMLCL